MAEPMIPDPGAPLRQQIGLYQLEGELGAQTPTGRGIKVGHVEGKPGDYLPNCRGSQFFSVTMLPRSGASKVNNHSQATADLVYGLRGLAPGIREAGFFSVKHWLGAGVIRAGRPLPPVTRGYRLFTHSWIGRVDDHVSAFHDVLRRADWLIDQHDCLIVAGVNNNAGSPVPALLASAHNVIAVGVASGQSSGGYTTLEGAGRCKPDIVAPRDLTSFATPVVTAVVARLLEAADRLGADQEQGLSTAAKAQVIKAVLMAGATKPLGWQPQPDRPLDEHLGVGSVRLDHSYRILTAKQTSPGRVSDSHAWDYNTIENSQTTRYPLHVKQPMAELSVVLVWNRRVDGRQAADLLSGEPRWLNTPRTADLDLQLIQRGQHQRERGLAKSASRVDNVEHIYREPLPPGDYILQVSRIDPSAEAWDYAIAWRMQPDR